MTPLEEMMEKIKRYTVGASDDSLDDWMVYQEEDGEYVYWDTVEKLLKIIRVQNEALIEIETHPSCQDGLSPEGSIAQNAINLVNTLAEKG